MSSLSHAVQEAESERQANRGSGGLEVEEKKCEIKLKINGEKWKERVCEREMGGGKSGWREKEVGKC